MTRLLLPLILFLLCAAAAIPASAEEAGTAGRVVAGVDVDYPGEVTPGITDIIGIRPGDRYSGRKVREGIKLLFLKGVFEDVVVEGRDTKEGVWLTYRLVPRIKMSSVEVDGNESLSAKKIKEKMALREGDYIEGPLLNKSRENILRLYHDEGFRDAEAAIAASKVDELRAQLTVLVKEGAPTVVREVKITGDTGLPVGDLYKKLEIEPGGLLRKEDMDASVSGMADFLVQKDYVKADVTVPKIAYEGGKADVEFNVKAGPRLEVSFEGNNSFSDRKLKKALTFWEDKDAGEESVSENLEKLSVFYKKEGYYFATLTSRTEESASPPIVSVKFIIYEGPRSKLVNIEFIGNKEMSADELRDVMELKESSFLRSRRITDEAVREDMERLKNYYESKGYLNAVVGQEDIKFSKDGSEATLRVDVDEGPRTYVTSIEVEGNKDIPTDKVREAIKQGSGSPFSPQRGKEDEGNVLNLYSQRGYINATLDVEKKFTGDGRGVALVYHISEGAPVFIGRLILKGNEYTRDKAVTRELLFEQGEPYDYEKILKSQQRVYKLGIFSQVKIQPVDQEKVEKLKDLLVSLKERAAGAVEFGAGYGEFDLYRGFAEVSYRNLFGLAHRVSLRGDLSTKEVKGVLNYKWPWFMDWPVDFRAGLVYLNAEKVNYKIKDFISLAGFDKTFNENVTGSVVYQYEKLKLSDVKSGAVLAPEDKKKSNLASITPSAIFDYRDDPFNPTKGSLHGFILKWASRYLGSTVDFVKLTAQTSWYYPLYKGIVFGVSARGGIEGWFSKKFDIPISERFFLGGASSLRGYKLDSVAPKSESGTPAGGDSMALFNAEVRFPLPYGFGLVTFVDAGNVWLLKKKVATGILPQMGTNGLKYGAGVGLRYETPVGPLRLDYGYKLTPVPGEPRGVLHFTLGHAF